MSSLQTLASTIRARVAQLQSGSILWSPTTLKQQQSAQSEVDDHNFITYELLINLIQLHPSLPYFLSPVLPPFGALLSPPKI